MKNPFTGQKVDKSDLADKVKEAKTDRNNRADSETSGQGGAEPRTHTEIKKAVDGPQQS